MSNVEVNTWCNRLRNSIFLVRYSSFEWQFGCGLLPAQAFPLTCIADMLKESRKGTSLPLQQPAFDLQTTTETAEAPGGDHPMSGKYQRQRIAAHGLAHGSRCGRSAHGKGHLAISHSLTEGDPGDGIEGLPLKWG
jgi:hypothetical protein